ncbi:MAG: YfhO family protein, partial [Patescibacteria group bacterium]
KELKNNNLVLAKKITNPFLPPLKIYRNNYFLPLAFGVFNVQSATSTEAMFSGLFDQNFDPAKTVILADNQSETAAAEKDSIAEVKILERQNSLVKIQADFSHPGYLVLSQSFASGWKATVDGGKAEIVRADYAFGAVKVSAGKHQVIFSYQPLAYSLGKWLTGLTFGLILVYLFFSLIIKPGLNKWKQ